MTTLKEAAEKIVQSGITLPQYSDIQLTEAETHEALRLARKNKAIKQKQDAYWKEVSVVEMPPIMKSGDYYKWVIQEAQKKWLKDNIEREFLISEGRHEVYDQLCRYFTNEPSEFLAYKGILLMGNVGAGKSFFLKLCSNNPHKSFHVLDVVKITREYSMLDDNKNPLGEKLIGRFRTELGPKSFDVWKHSRCGCLFDDLGWETSPIKMPYTMEEVNVMELIINAIYSASLPFSNYHATTNLNEEELELKYGSRIMSRLYEMFNRVILPGTDLRKQK